MSHVLRGAKSPEAYELTIRQAASGLDLTTVSAVNLTVRRKAGTITWATSLSSVTTTSLKATHTFAADGSDCPDKDTFEIIALLTVSGNIRRAAGPEGRPILLHIV
jgi:hypothetical protein